MSPAVDGWCLVGLLFLSGCVGGLPSPLDSDDPAAIPRIGWDGRLLDGTQPIIWRGPNLTALPGDYNGEEPPCQSTNCVRYPFELSIPANYWDSNIGGLAFSIAWKVGPQEPWRWFSLRILDSSGNVVARANPAELALVAFVPRIESGHYEAIVVMMPWSEGTFDASILVDSAPRPLAPREELPDLVTLTPSELKIEYPGDFIGCVDGNPAGAGWICQGAPPEQAKMALAAAGVKGCNVDEAVEHKAKRCLRFNNFLGNAGSGVLELWLSREEGTKAYSGQGQFVQRIHSSDGKVREVAAGPAAFHPFHRHFHSLGIVDFKIYRYDLATHTRGDAVSSDRKTGMCLFHSGLVELGKPGTRPAAYDSTCFETGSHFIGARVPNTRPLLETGWNMTLRPNWFDIYYWSNDENYVDVSGVPDGTYELVSTSNTGGFIQESTRDNNVGSVVFQMVGDAIKTLA